MVSGAHSHLCVVHLVYALSSWVRIKGGRQVWEERENHCFLPLIFVYRQQMTEKVLLALFSGARR